LSRRRHLDGEAISLDQRACAESVLIIRRRRSCDQRKNVAAVKSKVECEGRENAARRAAVGEVKGKRSDPFTSQRDRQGVSVGISVGTARSFLGRAVTEVRSRRGRSTKGKSRPRSGRRAARRAAFGDAKAEQSEGVREPRGPASSGHSAIFF